MKLINIGFGNMVSAGRIIAIVSPESAPIKRIIQDARDSATLIDAAESYLEAELQRVFEATAAAGADVFAVGKEAIRSFPSWDSWRACGFSERLKDARAVFRVKVKLSHSPRDPALE